VVKVLHEAVKVEGSKDEERKGRQEKENVCARCGTYTQRLAVNIHTVVVCRSSTMCGQW
jgi:hypothetical protein